MAITPDDKDWTWVLERPCPECGFDARDVAIDEIPSLLGGLAGAWREVLLRGEAGRRPTPDRWSPLEYACHVRDLFRVFDQRLQLMMTRDEARFENWDQDRTAVEGIYELQDPAVVSQELGEAAESLAARFARVTARQWEHRGLRSNGSEFTVSTFALYLAHDPIHHLWDVRDR